MQPNLDQQPNLSKNPSVLKVTVDARAQRFFFGDDIFVSYARNDSDYALALADELTKRGLACFVDQWGTPSGLELPKELVERLQRSTMLVIIGTQQAGASENVMNEVLEFKKTGRPIIPITFLEEDDFRKVWNREIAEHPVGTLERAVWYHEIAGIARTVESKARLKPGDANASVVPSAQVVTRIVNAEGFLSRSRRLRKTFWSTLASLLSVLVLAGLIGVTLIVKANQRVRQAQAEQASAEANANKAAVNLAGAERLRTEAEGKKAKAEQDLAAIEGKLDKASADLVVANKKTEEEQTKADKARREAARQSQIALSRQLSSSALSHLDDQLDEAMSLSMKAMAASPVPTFEARRSIFAALLHSPHLLNFIGKQKSDGHRKVAFSADGKKAASSSWERSGTDSDGNPTFENVVAVWDTNNAARKPRPLGRVGDQISTMIFSHDGQTLAVVDDQGKLHLWNTATGIELKPSPSIPSGRIDSIAFNMEGRELAVGYEYEPVSLCALTAETATCRALSPLEDPNTEAGQQDEDDRREVRNLAFSRSGNRLAVSLENGSVFLVKIDSHTPPVKLFQVKNFGNGQADSRAAHASLLFSPDGNVLAYAAETGKIVMWDLKAGKQMGDILEAGSTYYLLDYRLVFSPDSKLLASSGSWNTIRVWDVAEKQQKECPQISTDCAEKCKDSFCHLGRTIDLSSGNDKAIMTIIRDMTFSSDGVSVLAVTADRRMVRWNPQLEGDHIEFERALKGHEGSFDEVFITEDAEKVLTYSESGYLVSWDVEKPYPLGSAIDESEVESGKALPGQDPQFKPFHSVDSLALNPHRAELAVATDGVLLWDEAKQEKINFYPFPEPGRIIKIAFSSDGKELVWGDNRGYLSHLNVDSTQTPQSVSMPDLLAFGAASKIGGLLDVNLEFSPDLGLIAAQHDQELILLNGKSDQHELLSKLFLPELGNPHLDQTPFAFSADKKLIVGGHGVALYDLTNPRKPVRLDFVDMGAGKPFADDVASVRFSRDGKTLAIGTTGGDVVLFHVGKNLENLRTLGQVVNWNSGSNEIISLALSPDGKTLAAGSRSGVITLWDIPARAALGQFLPWLDRRIFRADLSAPVYELLFSNDSRRLVSVSRNGTISWDVDYESWERRARDVANFKSGGGGEPQRVKRKSKLAND